jgi:RecG-like helicase
MSTARILLLWIISVAVILVGWYLVKTDQGIEEIKEIKKELVETHGRVKEIEKELAETRLRVTILEARPTPKGGDTAPTQNCISSPSENKVVEGTISRRANLKGRVELSLSYYGACSITVAVFENTGISTDRLQTGAHIIVHGKVRRFKDALEITPEKSDDIRFLATQ